MELVLMNELNTTIEPKYITRVKTRAIIVLYLKLWSSDTTFKTSTKIKVEKVTVTISMNELSKNRNENVMRTVPIMLKYRYLGRYSSKTKSGRFSR